MLNGSAIVNTVAAAKPFTYVHLRALCRRTKSGPPTDLAHCQVRVIWLFSVQMRRGIPEENVMASRLLMSIVVVAATALATTAAWAQQPAPASAGCTGNEQFSDDFTQANDPSWPVPRADIAIGGGKFQGKAAANQGNWALTDAVPVGDADICFDLSVNPVSYLTATSGGLTFWFVDAGDNPTIYRPH